MGGSFWLWPMPSGTDGWVHVDKDHQCWVPVVHKGKKEWVQHIQPPFIPLPKHHPLATGGGREWPFSRGWSKLAPQKS